LADLGDHLAYLRAAQAEALAAPLSARKAMLVVMLADACADRLFAAQDVVDDILVFRQRLAARSEELALVFAIAAMREGGERLVTEAVAVPIDDYGRLSIEDFMVSLYNDHAVQRVLVALPDGGRRDVHEVLAGAIDALAYHNDAPLTP